jgi:hypothetical protein
MKKATVPWLVLGLLLVWALPAVAADTQPFKPQVMYPVKFDISKPLRDVKVGKPMEMGKPREVVNRSIPKVQAGGGGKYDTLQNFPGRLSTPTPLLTFQGLDSDDSQAVVGFRVMPPDTEGDVGPNHYFERSFSFPPNQGAPYPCCKNDRESGGWLPLRGPGNPKGRAYWAGKKAFRPSCPGFLARKNPANRFGHRAASWLLLLLAASSQEPGFCHDPGSLLSTCPNENRCGLFLAGF